MILSIFQAEMVKNSVLYFELLWKAPLPFEDLLTEADFRMNETQPPTSQKNSKIDTKLFDPLFFWQGEEKFPSIKNV